jgi:hypothetical protein
MIFGQLPSRNHSTNQNEISHDDKVGEATRCTKNGWSRLAGMAPQIGEIKPEQLFLLFYTSPYVFLLLYASTTQTA